MLSELYILHHGTIRRHEQSCNLGMYHCNLTLRRYHRLLYRCLLPLPHTKLTHEIEYTFDNLVTIGLLNPVSDSHLYHEGRNAKMIKTVGKRRLKHRIYLIFPDKISIEKVSVRHKLILKLVEHAHLRCLLYKYIR